MTQPEPTGNEGGLSLSMWGDSSPNAHATALRTVLPGVDGRIRNGVHRTNLLRSDTVCRRRATVRLGRARTSSWHCRCLRLTLVCLPGSRLHLCLPHLHQRKLQAHCNVAMLCCSLGVSACDSTTSATTSRRACAPAARSGRLWPMKSTCMVRRRT